MARLVVDRTQRTAPIPDQRLWRLAGGSSTAEPNEVGGYINLTTGLNAGQARHLISLRKPWSGGQGALWRVRRDVNTGTTRFRVWLEHSGTPTGTGSEQATSGYCMTVAATGDATVAKLVASTSTNLSTAAVTGKIPAATDVWIRGEHMAGRVRFRMWNDGTAEPGTWDHDYAEDAAVPAGVPAVSVLRSAGTTAWQIGPAELYAATGSLPSQSRPRLYNRLDGTRVPFGRRSQVRVDDVPDTALPTWLTGATVTADAATGTRWVTAAAGTTERIVGRAASGDAHFLTVDNLRLTADTQLGVVLGFTDGTNTYEFRHEPTGSLARMVVNGTPTDMPYQFRGNGEGGRHRSVTLALIPAVAQLIAFEGDYADGNVIGWVDLTGGPSRTTALTPSLGVVAGTSGGSVSYTQLRVEVQRLGGSTTAPTPPAAPVDSTAPTVPATPVATAGVTSASATTTGSTDAVGVTSYTWRINGTIVPAQNGTTVTVTGLAAGTPVSFTVTASDAAGNTSAQSAASNSVTPTANSDVTAPSVPGTPTATAGTTSASVAFPLSTDDTAVTAYRVYSSLDGYTAAVGTGATSPINCTGLSTVAQTFVVDARDAAGNTSAKSAASNSVTPTAQASGVVASDTFNRADSATLGTAEVGGTWQQSGTPQIGIVSAQALRSASGNAVTAWLPVSMTDGEVSAVIPTGSVANTGIMIRYVDDANYIWADVAPGATGSMRLFVKSGGANTAGGTATGFNFGQRLRLRIVGSTITVLTEDTVKITYQMVAGPASGFPGLRPSTTITTSSRWTGFEAKTL